MYKENVPIFNEVVFYSLAPGGKKRMKFYMRRPEYVRSWDKKSGLGKIQFINGLLMITLPEDCSDIELNEMSVYTDVGYADHLDLVECKINPTKSVPIWKSPVSLESFPKGLARIRVNLMNYEDDENEYNYNYNLSLLNPVCYWERSSGRVKELQECNADIDFLIRHSFYKSPNYGSEKAVTKEGFLIVDLKSKKEEVAAALKNYGIDMAVIDLDNWLQNCDEPNIVWVKKKEIPEGVHATCKKLENVTIGVGVQSIGRYAFASCRNLRKAEMPKSQVTEIKSHAFADCKSLTTVILPDSLEVLGNGAFKYCTELENLYLQVGYGIQVGLPEGLKGIGDEAFQNCAKLKDIVIPQGVKKIGKAAFKNCQSLKRIEIPKGVQALEDGVFEGCENLEVVIIPEGLMSIGENAFKGCKNLRAVIIKGKENERLVELDTADGDTVEIPKKVMKIEASAFEGCESIKKVEIHGNVERIECQAFANCEKLESVEFLDQKIPGMKIVTRAFARCRSLKNIELPNGLSFIGIESFKGCESLQELRLPGSVETIMDSAFEDCIGLRDMSFGKKLNKIGIEAFKNCKSLGFISFENGISSIEKRAFEGCENLATVGVLPESLTTIEDDAFRGCPKLLEVTSRNYFENLDKIFKGGELVFTVVNDSVFDRYFIERHRIIHDSSGITSSQQKAILQTAQAEITVQQEKFERELNEQHRIPKTESTKKKVADGVVGTKVGKQLVLSGADEKKKEGNEEEGKFSFASIIRAIKRNIDELGK